MLTSRLAPSHPKLLPSLTCALLVVTALVPLLHHERALPLAIAAAVGIALWVGTPGLVRYLHHSKLSARSVVRPTVELVLHLSPVALLTFVFPIASHRIGRTQVGGVSLTALLLASSLTVPWLGQAVCLPLYRAIGHLIGGGDMNKIQRRFCEVWPSTFAQCLPAVAVFAVPVELATRWPLRAFGTYLALCVLHLSFAQSLVLANVGRRRVLWAVAWLSYATALFVIPTAWYLPPLAGLGSQLVAMRRYLPQMKRPVMLDNIDVAMDLGRGVLLGAVLWSDKFFLYLRSGAHFAVTTVFLALLPAILAYNYYFVRLAPTFDKSVGALRTAMEGEPYSKLTERSSALAVTVEGGLRTTAFIGACLCFVVACLVSSLTPRYLSLAAAIAIASWLFMMITVLCYKLDYIGRIGLAQVFSAAHLVGCAGAFLLFPPKALLYITLSCFEVLVFVAALYSCLTQWRSSEYTLFWRHATAW